MRIKRRWAWARLSVGLVLSLIVLAPLAPAQVPPSLPAREDRRSPRAKDPLLRGRPGTERDFPARSWGRRRHVGGELGCGLNVRLRNRLSSISQNPQNLTRPLRLKNANVATTK